MLKSTEVFLNNKRLTGVHEEPDREIRRHAVSDITAKVLSDYTTCQARPCFRSNSLAMASHGGSRSVTQCHCPNVVEFETPSGTKKSQGD